jgi:hypothetical protein
VEIASKSGSRGKTKGNKMKRFVNNNELFGYEGPFEAESKEALADEMMPTLIDWAEESDRDPSDLRDEFIKSLVEVY